jgi:hypothetical protein
VAYDRKSSWGYSPLSGVDYPVEGKYPPIHGSDKNYYKPFKLNHHYDGDKTMSETALIERHEDFAPAPLSPQEQVDKASEMAKVLQDVVNQADLAKSFGGKKKHLEFEAWQTIGQFFNCTPVTEWTRPIKEGENIIGWESRVKVVNADGRTIAAAESMCMRDEKNWKSKPNYALRSMAQTRAGGKALRSVFAFVAVLAGYSATPSEEMIDSFNKSKEKPKPKVDAKPTAKQVKMIFGKGEEHSLSQEETTQIVEWWRKGDKLTKAEASELIDRMVDDFDKLLDEFMLARESQEPDDIPL